MHQWLVLLMQQFPNCAMANTCKQWRPLVMIAVLAQHFTAVIVLLATTLAYPNLKCQAFGFLPGLQASDVTERLRGLAERSHEWGWRW